MAGTAAVLVLLSIFAPSARAQYYPIYQDAAQWMMLDRAAEPGAGKLRAKTNVLVIGSQGAGLFAIARGSITWNAACKDQRRTPVQAYVLSAKNAGEIGTPILGLPLAAKAIDTRHAKFYKLENQVSEQTYDALLPGAREATLAEVQSNDFAQLRFDFGAPIEGAKKEAFVTVESAQLSNSYRRCLRLFLDGKPAGRCADMPHAQMAETAALDFVAYDAKGRGFPMILLGYTPRQTVWGAERWAFKVSEKGAQRFFMDTLDPRCRDRF